MERQAKVAIKEDNGTKLDRDAAGKIIHILMWSKFYFTLTLKERHALLKYILDQFPFTPVTEPKEVEELLTS